MVTEVNLPRLGFVHVPKTAGTSITSRLVATYGSLALSTTTTTGYEQCTETQINDHLFYGGHAYRRDYRRWPSDTKKFTVLRDPVSRSISFYNYCRGIDPKQIHNSFMREVVTIALECDIVEFLHSDSPFLIEHIRSGQLRQFLSERTLKLVGHRQHLSKRIQDIVLREFVSELKSFDYVMTTDYLAPHFAKMIKELGLFDTKDLLAVENRSNGDRDINRMDVRRALVDINAAEIEGYEHVRSLESSALSHYMNELRVES